MRLIKRRSHYEIDGYIMGTFPQLERLLSVWDDNSFKLNEYYYYDDENQILYFPGGVDASKIVSYTNGMCIEKDNDYNEVQKTVNFTPSILPREITQKEAIRFLAGQGEYSYTKNSSQLVLSLPGGVGKTYCAVAAMSIFAKKSIVIVHNEKIRSQWIEKIPYYTNLPKKGVMALTSTEQLEMIASGKKIRGIQNVAFFVCTHRLLGNYMKKHGFHSVNGLMKKLDVAVKIFDEAHLEFRSILMLDYAINTWKTFYLTATFGRSDFKDNMIFQTSFQDVYKLIRGDDSIGRDRNVVYIAYVLDCKVSAIEAAAITIRKRFNVHRYFDVEMKYEKLFDTVSYWLDWYYNKKGYTGKTFLLSSKKETCDKCNQIASELFPDKRTAVHYTGDKVDALEEYDILSATDRMLGTGTDLDNLGMVINLVPISSSGNIDQIVHRLMRGKSTEDAFYIEGIDSSVPQVMKMYDKRSRVVRKIAKKAFEFRG